MSYVLIFFITGTLFVRFSQSAAVPHSKEARNFDGSGNNDSVKNDSAGDRHTNCTTNTTGSSETITPLSPADTTGSLSIVSSSTLLYPSSGNDEVDRYLRNPPHNLRFPHPPPQLIPIDKRPTPSLFTETKFFPSTVVQKTTATSLPSSLYQPVVHMENENVSTNDLLKFMSLIGQQYGHSDIKSEVFPNTESPTKISEEEAVITHRQLRAIFRLSRPAQTPLLRCQNPDVTVSVKCLSNFARAVFMSENTLDAKATSIPSQQQVQLSGYKSVLYVVWWTKNEEQFSEMGPILNAGQLKRQCYGCRNHSTVLLLQEEDHGCLIPIVCGSPESERVIVDGSKKVTVGPITNSVAVVASSMVLHSTAREDEFLMVDRVKSGNQLRVLLGAATDSFSVGVFVKECYVQRNSSPPVTLLSNGCSVSNLLDNFILTNHSKKKMFSLHSRLTAFSAAKESQQFTFGCRITVCEGLCNIHSSCQPSLSDHGASLNSRVIYEGSLQATFIAEPEDLKEPVASDLLVGDIRNRGTAKTEPTSENFVSKTTFYASIFSLSCIYLVVLVFCVVCVKYSATKQVSSYHVTEIESTPRSVYHENSFARRRSPNTAMYMN